MVRALLAATILATLVLAAPAAASDGMSIQGTLEVIDGEGRSPVAGVTITVTRDDTVVGVAVTDDTGAWKVEVPGAGIYAVTLDVATLPEGVALSDPGRSTLPQVEVRTGQEKVVRFNLGPGVGSTVDAWNRVWGLALIGLKLGAIIALCAIGLSLIFGVTGLVNFAHGDLVTLGAMLAFLFNATPVGPGWHLVVATVPAVLLSGAFGAAQELGLWRPLRRRRSGLISLIVVSIGLGFVIRYLVLVAFKGQPRPYSDYAVQAPIDFLGAPIVPKSLVVIGISVVALVAVGIFLMRTKTGTAMRAVADNADLAESSGIDVGRVILVTWVMGSALAGLGGVLMGASEQVQWDMGSRLLLLVFAAVVLGGLGTAFGAMLGGFVIGVAVEMSTLVLPVEFKHAVALGILIVMLLVRPQGLLGLRERVG